MAKKPSNKKAVPAPIDQRLVLNRWALSLFGLTDFKQFGKAAGGGRWMDADDLEGVNAEGVTHFHDALRQTTLPLSAGLTVDDLLRYDANIVRHWRQIAERRSRAEGRALWPKYFQYLALLFAEIYLDRFTRDEAKLLAEVNAFADEFNAGVVDADRVKAYAARDLRMLAFWMATGSGKTLLMHVNILQYRHYLAANRPGERLNRVILLTPNEGLSRQHLGELAMSGIAAEFFDPDASGRGLYDPVEIIEVTKLKEKKGEKTVAVESFEGKNLVLVDEGHRGAGGDAWMDARAALAEGGFSFEYSATFKQALKAANDAELTERYCRSILFDYSYKFFYSDGYGKEYDILNLADEAATEAGRAQRQLYLTACLLAFYQQQRLWSDKPTELRPFLVDRPLWVFVGGSVNAKDSDVVEVLKFLDRFLSDREGSVRAIDRLVGGSAGLLDQAGRDLFRDKFAYLASLKQPAATLFADVVKRTFNSDAGGGRLRVENLKGAEGELGLRLGDAPYFGVVNVGDEGKLLTKCETEGLTTGEATFTGSIFSRLDDPRSETNILIGARKFTEGWSSWRVSTMGLLNIGRSEGSQIIQLFGRGVRLKGFEFGLKRSTSLPARAPKPPRGLRTVETLNIFGVRADYMRAFQEYLKEEDVPVAHEKREVTLPVFPSLGDKKLKVLRVREGIDFKRTGPRPTLSTTVPESLKKSVELDWYPRVESMRSGRERVDLASRHQGWLTEQNVAFLDLDAIYFELQRHKAERASFNLNLPRGAIAPLLLNRDWYELWIPADDLKVTTYDRVREWQEIAVALLKKYIDRLYNHFKGDYEKDFLEPVELKADDPNFDFGEAGGYRVSVEEDQGDLFDALEALANEIKAGKRDDWKWRTNDKSFAIGLDAHLFYPLVYKANIGGVEVSPVPLVESEYRFVVDLRAHLDANRDAFAGRQIYLLRNRSRKGLGFFEAGNFYPDFILWVVADGVQHVAFIDPKGLRNVAGRRDPKIEFAARIKEREARINNPALRFASFVLSSTPYNTTDAWWSRGQVTRAQFEQSNVLFQHDDGYIASLFSDLLNTGGSAINDTATRH